MSWQVHYCLDFGFCFDYPEKYWHGYFNALIKYGYNTFMLWVAGILPMPGYEKTLAWRCDYFPKIVEYLHSQNCQVFLMTGVHG